MTQAVKVAPGEPYGMREQLEAAQATIPLPNNAGVPGPSQPPAQGAPGMPAPQPALAGAQEFARPTERPNEPVTAGLPVGPGPGPEVLSAGPDLIGAQLRALYQVAPNNDILRLIELHDRGF